MNFDLIEITLDALESTSVRRSQGQREIWQGLGDADPHDDEGLRGWLNAIARGVIRIGNFIWAAIEWIIPRINLPDLWGAIQEAAYTLFYFDWNQSDASIAAQVTANNNAMAQLIGRFAGSGAVRLVSVGIAAGVAMKYPIIAGRVALELAEDTGGTLRAEFMGMLQGIRQIAIENGLLKLVLGFRQRRWFGMEPRTADGPYDSFANRIESAVQSIPNEWFRNFVSGLLEGAEDAFWDVGYIVAQTVDDFVSTNRYTNNSAFGPERVVKITPDVRREEEAIVLAGPQELVQMNVDQTLATHRLIDNRDVGQIVGIPAESFPRARFSVRHLVITFKAKRRPPWRTQDGRVKEIQYTIPDCKRSLSWGEIKSAARAFTWGPWRCTANLDNNRQMAVYGASSSEAESTLRSLIRLSTADIVTLSVTEEVLRDPRYIKRPTQVWAAYANLVTVPTDIQGQPLGGDRALRRERRRIILWTDDEPDDLGPLD